MSRYQLQDYDEGLCSCGSGLRLLTHARLPDGYPTFLICFLCRSVVEIQGQDGERVQFKGGRRRRFTASAKDRKKTRKGPVPHE